MMKEEIHAKFVEQGIPSTISHMNSQGRAIWKIDWPGYENGVTMFQPDAAELASGKASIHEIISRNRGANLG